MSNPKIDTRGTKRWFNSTRQLHREDGPAIEWSHGTKSWWINGQSHRLNGPAWQYADGTCSYFINGQQLTKDEWKSNPLRIEYVIKENIKLILND